MSPDRAFSIALSHGQARWLLAELRLGWTADEARFDTWLKALRRAGVPFDGDELGVGTGQLLAYGFVHLMELALALLLKSTGLLDGHSVELLRSYRPQLRKLYDEAWRERASGRGEPLLLEAPGSKLRLQGLYLDLAPEVLQSGVLSLPEPRLLGPLEAVQKFGARHRDWYPRPPFPVSDLAADIVRLAEDPPTIRRGRPKAS